MPLLSPFNGHNTKSVVILDNVSIHHVDTVVMLSFQLEPFCDFFQHTLLTFGEMKQYLRTNNVLFETYNNWPEESMTLLYLHV